MLDIQSRQSLVNEWLAEGFSCNLCVDEPGKIWADCNHQMQKRIMLLRGEITILTPHKRRRPRIGEVVTIASGMSHSLLFTCTRQTFWLCGFYYDDRSTLPTIFF